MPQILIADDSPSIRQLVRAMLQSEGYTLQEATDGAEALTVLRAADAPMVVLLDYEMPNLTGEGVLRAVADDSKGLLAANEYIVISAHADTFPESFIDLLRHLSIRVLKKPFEREQLVPLVAQAIVRLTAPREDIFAQGQSEE
ncbi:MAG TPA: response regulator [Ktedonobacterales bacterium]|jgi:CheY-like chemotaxis protein|nr:response regulator [Ktedonobacterales bacterium]